MGMNGEGKVQMLQWDLAIIILGIVKLHLCGCRIEVPPGFTALKKCPLIPAIRLIQRDAESCQLN